jgi:hypothetical protein
MKIPYSISRLMLTLPRSKRQTRPGGDRQQKNGTGIQQHARLSRFHLSPGPAAFAHRRDALSYAVQRKPGGKPVNRVWRENPSWDDLWAPIAILRHFFRGTL